ncbi:MAG: ABC transporter permease [Candidatus Hermodarchaeota archaeon]
MSFQALTDRKLRSTLTVTMVIIGVALLVAVNGLSSAITVYVDDQFQALGPTLLVVQPGAGGGIFGGFSLDEEEVPPITVKDIEKITTIEGIKHVVPYIQSTARISRGSKEETTMVVGMDTRRLPLIFPQFEIVKGNYLESTDSYGIILSGGLADLNEGLFADVGESVKITYTDISASISLEDIGDIEETTKSFSVRGIAGETGWSMTIAIENTVYISLAAANQLFGRNQEYDGIYVLTEDPEVNIQVEEAIEGQFDVTVLSPTAIAETMGLITGALGGFLDAIAIVSLGVAAVGIITTLWTSMMERVKEIGTLKALGYTKRQILVLFLNEALIIGVLGGIMGLLLGMIGGTILSAVIMEGVVVGFGEAQYTEAAGFSLTPVFDPGTLVLFWAIAVVLSVIAGFYPAKKAADLDPVVALRKE